MIKCNVEIKIFEKSSFKTIIILVSVHPLQTLEDFIKMSFQKAKIVLKSKDNLVLLRALSNDYFFINESIIKKKILELFPLLLSNELFVISEVIDYSKQPHVKIIEDEIPSKSNKVVILGDKEKNLPERDI